MMEWDGDSTPVSCFVVFHLFRSSITSVNAAVNDCKVQVNVYECRSVLAVWKVIKNEVTING